jgi:alginate O-acetyltransferase complex protein AlgI
MVFNSVTFLVFLAITLSLYYRLGHRGQNWMLLLASYFFYGWWDFRFTFLLLFTSFFDYFCALWIDHEQNPRKRKMFLAFSIIVNMAVLCIFKYYNFFAESLRELLGTLGIHASFPILYVVLPVGISFYTFLSMSYTIDVYRKELQPARNPVDFLLYVSFFPHLVAGPIVRASYLLPQCQAIRVVKQTEVVNGIWLMLVGYVKKVVIADQLGQVVTWGFSGSGAPFPNLNSWFVVYAFAFQIYGDFAGYSDIARGLAKLMGFELVENFRAPYLVTNPSNFWRNWHISLSTWLRDYLYIPLGGNRGTPGQTYRNLMITMLLGGLWHGAGIAYIIWGLYHGLLLAIHRWWTEHFPPRQERPASSAGWDRLKTAAKILVFFHITCIGWLIFRAGALKTQSEQMQTIKSYLTSMTNVGDWSGLTPLAGGILALGLLGLFFQWKHELMDRFSQWQVRWQIAGATSALALITVLGVFEGSQFIYFQF